MTTEAPNSHPLAAWGACGVEDCTKCSPLFDKDNNPIEGT